MNFAAFAFQDVPPLPGQTGAGKAETAQPTRAAADAAPPPPGGALMNLLPFLIIIPMVLFLFWSSRSQQKKQEATIAALKKGDRVVTQSGLIGRLTEIDGRYAKVELAPGVKVQMLRSALAGRQADDGGKAADKKA